MTTGIGPDAPWAAAGSDRPLPNPAGQGQQPPGVGQGHRVRVAPPRRRNIRAAIFAPRTPFSPPLLLGSTAGSSYCVRFGKRHCSCDVPQFLSFPVLVIPPLGGSSGWRFGQRQRVDWPAACLQVYGCWLAGPEPRSSRPVCNAGQPWLGLSPFPPSRPNSLSVSPPLFLALPPSLPPSLGVCCMLPRELTRACGCLSLCWLSLLVTSLTRPPAGQPRLGFGELLPDLFLIADRKLF